MSKELAVLKVNPEDHDKFSRSVQQGNETQADAFHRENETFLVVKNGLPKLQFAFERAVEKIEGAKKTGLHSQMVEGASELVQAVEQFVKAIEAR